VFGEEVSPNSTAHLGRIGYFDQLRPLYGSFRVEEMLAFGRRLNSKWDHASARQWLDDLDIPMKEKVGKLSLGQQAEVALAVCMGKQPDLLLLDEPVASLDPLARTQLLRNLMAAVAERGTTVFLSSHIVSELEPVCDNLIILSASKVQITDTIDDLLAGHRLLVGPREQVHLEDLDVISRQETGRQMTLLVRGAPPRPGPEWQDLQPGLDEIVLAYLATPTKGEHRKSGLNQVQEEGDL
jgi:ABC-2 type transport system ATP-binding protein